MFAALNFLGHCFWSARKFPICDIAGFVCEACFARTVLCLREAEQAQILTLRL